MTGTGPRLDRRSRAAVQAERQRLWAQAQAEPDTWYAGSTVLSGVLLFGGLGWLLGHWQGWIWPTPVGVVLGMAAAVTSLWFRYGVARQPPPDTRTTSADALARTGGGSPHDHRPTDRCPMEDEA